MVVKPLTLLRRSANCLGVIVGCYAVWLLAVGLTRAHEPSFSTGNISATTNDQDLGAAALAAMLGLVRSDLWADYAIRLAADRNSKSKSVGANAYTKVGAAAERAIALGPHDARSWLLLAEVHARIDGLNRTISGPLRMSYYTGPNDFSLMPTRLSLATATDAITDPEIRDLATNDVRTILLHRFELKPAISAAYRSASPDGKHLIEAAVSLFDPGFLQQLQPATAPQ